MMDNNEHFFSLDKFQQWMDGQAGNDITSMKRPDGFKPGIHVYPITSNSKRLSAKMNVEEGELVQVVKEFRQSGGVIQSIDQKYLVIEVNTGRFAIPAILVTADF